jgi:hypothetical protein
MYFDGVEYDAFGFNVFFELLDFVFFLRFFDSGDSVIARLLSM